MVTANNVERNAMGSFRRVKEDVKVVARWINWNKKEHEALNQRISELEIQVRKINSVRLIGSSKTRRVHSANCVHAKKIKAENKTYFELLGEARERGYSMCDCAAISQG